MTAPPKLTDRTALALHRARAAANPALFLHELAADDVKERLKEVNRPFTNAAVISPFPAFWGAAFPDARSLEEAEILPLDEAAHDLVIHALALHWSDDPVGQLVQSRRALAPDGLFIGVLFGGRSLHELRAALAATETDLMGGLSPRVVPMADLRELGALLLRAGFALPVADSITRTVSYQTAFHLMRDLRAMGETNALAARHRACPPRAFFAEAARRYADAHAGPDGRIPASVELIYLTGWAPAQTQPKPLRPGAAQTRLADALGTTEHGLSDRPRREPD